MIHRNYNIKIVESHYIFFIFFRFFIDIFHFYLKQKKSGIQFLHFIQTKQKNREHNSALCSSPYNLIYVNILMCSNFILIDIPRSFIRHRVHYTVITQRSGQLIRILIIKFNIILFFLSGVCITSCNFVIFRYLVIFCSSVFRTYGNFLQALQII